MNKQEAIKELESLKMKSKEIRSECYNSGINAGITILNKLDEPQKAVVPKFVGEYLNYCMAIKRTTLREALITGKIRLPEYLHKAVDWLNDSMNQNIFAQAWLFGYEVERVKYRKKPVVVEAIQLTDENLLEVKDWCNGELVPNAETSGYDLYISTLEGAMCADINDYIIRGVEGEFYPCKPDIFEKTYEAVEE